MAVNSRTLALRGGFQGRKKGRGAFILTIGRIAGFVEKTKEE